MLPTATLNDIPNRPFGNAKLRGKSAPRMYGLRSVLIFGSYFIDLLGRQFCLWAAFFFCHIRRIIGCCPQKQVVRVAAASFVAVMANHHSGWDGTKFQLPCEPVRVDGLSWISKIDLPVTLVIAAAGPQQATMFCRRAQTAIQSFFDGNCRLSSPTAFPRAELASSNFDFGRECDKLRPTELTSSCNFSTMLRHC